MLIVIIAITILLGIFLYYLYEEDGVWSALFLLVIEIIPLLVLVGLLINTRAVDQKIELYVQQNKEIESKVENAVKQYMEHENKTFTGLKTDESYITLVSLYPELKSDELIKEEIKLYEKNNKKIISLKEENINKTIYKWWIYFGK